MFSCSSHGWLVDVSVCVSVASMFGVPDSACISRLVSCSVYSILHCESVHPCVCSITCLILLVFCGWSCVLICPQHMPKEIKKMVPCDQRILANARAFRSTQGAKHLVETISSLLEENDGPAEFCLQCITTNWDSSTWANNLTSLKFVDKQKLHGCATK